MLLDHLVTHLRADVGRYMANVTGLLWLRVLLDSAAQPQVHVVLQDSAAQPQVHVVLLEKCSTATSARCVTSDKCSTATSARESKGT